MIVTLLGVRGSRPVSRAEVLQYGGNTTSFKVEVRGMPPIFIDGGTGLYEEGIRLANDKIPEKIYFLSTHTHWDHILAIPYFRPLYEEGCHVHFLAAKSQNNSFADLIRGQHNPMAFPVPFSELKSKQTFVDVKSGDFFELDRARVTAFQLNHPGTTLGWKIEADDRSIAIITDNAPISDNYLGEGMKSKAKTDPKAFEEEFNNNLIEFIKNVDLVIFDTHFSEENIKGKKDWGHSTPDMAIDFCLKAQVKKLVLHHHAPEDVDKVVEQKAEKAWNKVKDQNLQIEAASEGMRIWL